MRTKHLMMAAVLPALFAACTNEELVDLSQTAPVAGLDGRQLVEDVTLTVNGTVSRLAYDGEFTFEAGDKIGACLMDTITKKYNADNAKWSERFQLVDYIQTNYKFTRDEAGQWNTEAKLCEGNYFFAYPYNENKGSRDAYTFEIPANQVLAGNAISTSRRESYIDNNHFIGYNKITKGSAGESVNIDMVEVFGSVGISLFSEAGQDANYTIKKLVLKGTDIKTKAVVDPTSCTYHPVENTNNFNVAQFVGDKNDGWTNINDYKQVDALKDLVDYKEGDGEVTITIDGGYVLAPQKTLNVIAMVAPAELGENNDLTLDVYTDKGAIKGINLKTLSSDEDYKTKNYSVTKAVTSIGHGSEIAAVKFDNQAFDKSTSLDVKGAEDLAMLIEWNAADIDAITANLKGDVTLTKEVVAALNASKISKMTISGSNKVTIPADAVGALDSKFDFQADVVIAAGEHAVTAKTVVAEGKSITVNKGATLNVNAEKAIAITNNGTLNVNAKANGEITNNGTATIAAGKTAAKVTNVGTLTNNGTITTLTDNKSEKNSAATVNNNGTIATLTDNNGTINNAGAIKGTANNGKIVMKKANATLMISEGSGEVDNTVLSSTVSAGSNAITVELSNVTAAKVKEVVELSGATKLYLSGTVTNDSVDKDGEPVDIVWPGILNVVAEADLTFTGKGTIKMSDVSDKATTLTINPNVKVTIKSGAAVGTGNGQGKVAFAENAQGKKTGRLVIEKNATFYTTTSFSEVKDNVDNYNNPENWK